MKTTRGITILTALAAITLAASPAAAQAPAKKAAPKETAAQLKAEAKVSEKDARATALSQVPGGTVKKYELEREGGKLLYSFDIAAPGKTGIEEVQVDAITGTVLSNKHETPAMEKTEAKGEAKEAKAAKHAKHAKAAKGALETKKP
jgi:uncharacterized membrane protein YkoI